MIKTHTRLAVTVAALAAAGTGAWIAPTRAQAPSPAAASIRVTNPLGISRTSETIVLPAGDVQRHLGKVDLRKVHVRDAATNADLLVQAVDTNDDGEFEELIVQADFDAKQRKTFTLSVGDRPMLHSDAFKAYGRFVRERRDDFAWENDRIAHRMYGAALETFSREPLTSTAVDVWSKRVSRLVINDWYLLDNYHEDHGEGGDFYSAGSSRGCGGNAIWAAGALHPSANFRDSRVLANGPIRVMFELVYAPWKVGNTTVSEVKRITLDAGQNLGQFESHYTIDQASPDLAHAVGIKKNAGSARSLDTQAGILRTWEPVKGAPGNLGCGVVFDPSQFVEAPDGGGDYLVVTRLPASRAVSYHAGFAWDQTGQVPGGTEGWDRYLKDFASRLHAPVVVEWIPGGAER